MTRTINKISYHIKYDEELSQVIYGNPYVVIKVTEGLHLKKKVPHIPYKEEEVIGNFGSEEEAVACLVNLQAEAILEDK